MSGCQGGLLQRHLYLNIQDELVEGDNYHQAPFRPIAGKIGEPITGSLSE